MRTIKTIIQETETITIHREFCPFTWRDERFVIDKRTGVESMFAEDVARIMGYSDIHAMIEDPNVLDVIDLSILSPGIYPITTFTVAEAKKLFESIEQAPLKKAEFLEQNLGRPFKVSFAHPEEMGDDIPEKEMEFALGLLRGSNSSIGKAALVPALSSTGESRIAEKQFAIELEGVDGSSIVLTQEDLTEIRSILQDFIPSEATK